MSRNAMLIISVLATSAFSCYASEGDNDYLRDKVYFECFLAGVSNKSKITSNGETIQINLAPNDVILASRANGKYTIEHRMSGFAMGLSDEAIFRMVEKTASKHLAAQEGKTK